MVANCHKCLAEYGELPYPRYINKFQEVLMASNDEAKVWVRMPKEIHVMVSAQAERERRSVNSQILVLLERVLASEIKPEPVRA